MNDMNDFKFRIGQTVYSPFGVVKIIYRWHGKSSTFYDVKFIAKKDDEVFTKTYTFEEYEMASFESGGVAAHEDDAVEMLSIKEIDGELIATFSVWIQIKIGDQFYSLEKQFQEKLANIA